MSSFLNTKQRVIENRVLVTGVCPMRIITINPTREELAEIINKKVDDVKEPIYTGMNDKNIPFIRLDFWMRSEEGTNYKSQNNQKVPADILVKMAIFIQNNPKTNKDGTKTLFINGKCQTFYSGSLDEAVAHVGKNNNTWFSEVNARECFVGEDTLYSFFTALINADLMDKDTNIRFEDFDAILDGNVTELRNIVNSINRSIKVLIGIRNNQYLDVFTGFFMPQEQTSYTIMHRKAKDPYSRFKSDFQNSMELKEFVPAEMVSRDEELNSVPVVENDDNPF
jgi:hypothetical protein